MAKPRAKKILMVIVGVMVLAMLLSFEKVAEVAGDAVNIPVKQIRDITKIVLGGAIGLFLIYSGVMAMALPWLGASLIIVGVAVLGSSVWPLFGGPAMNDE